jgi:hypothetical protein
MSSEDERKRVEREKASSDEKSSRIEKRIPTHDRPYDTDDFRKGIRVVDQDGRTGDEPPDD